jgi:lactoylglutathione lyase
MLRLLLVLALAVTLVGCNTAAVKTGPEERTDTMELGNFSVSLAVKDLAASQAFYEKLGFTTIFGDATQNWLILRNGNTKIGLFQGMFEDNIMTFNPGWSDSGEPLAEFTDIRDIQRHLKEQGVTIMTEADENTDGPASFVLADPDGNLIMLDQHVSTPD